MQESAEIIPDVILLPDAGPLITLAYADALEVLLMLRWKVTLVDMVLHEVTRNETPTSGKISAWAKRTKLAVIDTKIYRHHIRMHTATAPRKSNLGELAVQEAMHGFALAKRTQAGVFLFEDHKIARVSFLLPDNCHKISTRAFLLFLEEKALIVSAAAIEREAIQNGRRFSALRFPNPGVKIGSASN